MNVWIIAINVLVLLSFIRLLRHNVVPQTLAINYGLINGFLSLLSGQAFGGSLITALFKGILAYLYFWLLKRYSQQVWISFGIALALGIILV